MQPPLPDPPSLFPLPQRSVKASKWPFKNPAVPKQLSLGACKEATGANQSLPATCCSCRPWLEGLQGRAFSWAAAPVQPLCKLGAGTAITPWTCVPFIAIPRCIRYFCPPHWHELPSCVGAAGCRQSWLVPVHGKRCRDGKQQPTGQGGL